MKEYYIIKVGNMYLNDIFLCEDDIENEFIHIIEIIAGTEDASRFNTESEAVCICNKLYITTGLKGEVVEVKEND